MVKDNLPALSKIVTVNSCMINQKIRTPVNEPTKNPRLAGKKLRWSPFVGCAQVLPSILDTSNVNRQYTTPITISKKVVLFLGSVFPPSVMELPRNAPTTAYPIHGNNGYVPVEIKCERNVSALSVFTLPSQLLSPCMFKRN